MAYLTLVFQLVTSALLLIGPGNGFPTRTSNATLRTFRGQKTNVKFPANEMGDSQWSMFSVSNMSRASASEDPFVFPDELSKKPKFTPVVSKRSPNCAKGSTFCEAIDDYPGDYLSNVLADKVDEFRPMLGVDEVLPMSGIGHRIDIPDENPLCASVEQVVYPKTAKNKDDKWLYIVNQNPYMQGVRIEMCQKSSNSGEMPCQFSETFPLGYKTMCKQKYIYRKLVALDEQGKPVTDTFQLPSCCSCTVKAESVRLGARIGALRNPTTPASTTPPKVKPKDVA